MRKPLKSDLCMMKIALADEASRASTALKAVPGVGAGPMGLTPDSVKARPDYKAAKQAYAIAWEKMRAFNAKYCR